MKTWQPISTAPKDKTRVLLFGGGYMETGYYDDSPRIGPYPNWRWPIALNPTHWMPLPNPPKIKK